MVCIKHQHAAPEETIISRISRITACELHLYPTPNQGKPCKCFLFFWQSSLASPVLANESVQIIYQEGDDLDVVSWRSGEQGKESRVKYIAEYRL